MDSVKSMADREVTNGNVTLDAGGGVVHPHDEFNVFFEFVVPGVLLNIIGLLGLLGNILSIVILSRPQMKSSIHCLLLGLASYDSVLLLTSILMFGLPAVYSYTQQKFFEFYFFKVFPFITPVVYPVGMIAQTGSVYLTLCVSVERYVAVCLPLKARAICTFGRARCYVISLGIFAFLYNIPRFWEVTWETIYYADLQSNVTNVVQTKLRENPMYISVYITWLYLVVMYIVPFICLALFNLLIYHQVRRANSERARLTRLQKKEIGLATMLMVVVFVFFVCNILALVVNILEVMKIQIIALNNVSNLLITINSSVNFIIYCIFGEKFKKIFCRIFCPFLLKGRDQHDFVQRYPEGGALVGGPGDRAPRRRNSASALVTDSKVPGCNTRTDTLTTRDMSMVRGRTSSTTVLGTNNLNDSRVEMTHLRTASTHKQRHSQQIRRRCNEADDEDFDDDDSGREEEEGPLIRATLVSASSIPVFLSSRQQHHHGQVPNGIQGKGYGTAPNGSEKFSVCPMIHHDQDGQRQHSLYIPKHDISITVNINTCSNDVRRNNNNNISSEVVATTTTAATTSHGRTGESQQGDELPEQQNQQQQQRVNQKRCCREEKNDCLVDENNDISTTSTTRVRLTCVSSEISLSLIREEDSDEVRDLISNDEDSENLDSNEKNLVSNEKSVPNGIIDQQFVDKKCVESIPLTSKASSTPFRHFVSPSNFTDEEKETLFLSETSQSRHEIETMKESKIM